LSTTSPTWPDQGSNLGGHGGKPPTNRLSHGAAILSRMSHISCGLRNRRRNDKIYRVLFMEMALLHTVLESCCGRSKYCPVFIPGHSQQYRGFGRVY
jgi:hypothetical protein